MEEVQYVFNIKKTLLVAEALLSTFLKKPHEYCSCNMRYFVTLKPDGASVNPKFLKNHSQ